MKLSGQSQAEIIKAAMVVAVAGVIVYAGKKFFDAASAKLGSVSQLPGEAIAAAGAAAGAAGAAVVEAAKSGIEKASENVKQIPPTSGESIIANTAKAQVSSGFMIPAPIALGAAAGQSLADKITAMFKTATPQGIDVQESGLPSFGS